MTDNGRRQRGIVAFVRTWFAVIVVAAVAGCMGDSQPGASKLAVTGLQQSSALGGDNLSGISDEVIGDGLAALDAGDFLKASATFNGMLVNRPRNATAHFLNGLTYHLMARAGDSSRYVLAKIGYQSALRFEPSTWVAAYQLGHLYYEQKSFAAAQEQFAYALLYDERNVRLLLDLAAASYYARDLPSALGAIKLAEEAAPSNQAVLMAATMIYSANNLPDEAQDRLQRYQTVAVSGDHLPRLTDRVGDWGAFYQRRDYLYLAQTDDSSDEETSDSDDTSESDDEEIEEIEIAKMVVVEAAIIVVEGGASTRKGLNLLENLVVTLSGDLSFSRDKVVDKLTGFRTSDDQTTSITGSVSTGSITYSLNIANASVERAELIARPALIALDGEESAFFAGSTEHLAIVSDNTTGIEEIDVGVTLTITPTFLTNDIVQLAVEIERDNFAPTTLTTFGESFRTTKTTMTASVIMRFGETLILSGLTQKEMFYTETGVPFLKDIPGVQYFFNREEDIVKETTILILLTPKRPAYAYRAGDSGASGGSNSGTASSDNLGRFKSRYEEEFSPAPTIEKIFDNLQTSDIYREFRTGDIIVGSWDSNKDIAFTIKQALGFLYY